MTKQHTATILVSLASRRLYVYLVDHSVDTCASFLSEARLVYACPVFIIVVQSLTHVQLCVPRGLHHARFLCPPLSPRVCSNLSPQRQGCYLTISSSEAPFSFCLESLPPLGSFPVSLLFVSGGEIIGASASASVLPMNIQGGFPLGLTSLISLQFKGLQSSPAPQFKSINSLVLSLCYGPTLTSVHDYWKNHSFDYMDLCCQNDVWGNIKAERCYPSAFLLSY